MAEQKASWPAWWYDPKTGEGKIFQKADDVPQGWTDDPHAHLGQNDEAPAKQESPNKGLAKEHGLTKKAMLADFRQAEVEVDASLSVDDLAAIYLDTFETDPDGGEEDPGEDEE